MHGAIKIHSLLKGKKKKIKLLESFNPELNGKQQTVNLPIKEHHL